jgi:hypothetical protein
MDTLKPLFRYLSTRGSSNFRVNGIISPVTYPFINLTGRFKPLEFTYEITGYEPLMEFLLEWTSMNHATIRDIEWINHNGVIVSIQYKYIRTLGTWADIHLETLCMDISNKLQYRLVLNLRTPDE